MKIKEVDKEEICLDVIPLILLIQSKEKGIINGRKCI